MVSTILQSTKGTKFFGSSFVITILLALRVISWIQLFQIIAPAVGDVDDGGVDLSVAQVLDGYFVFSLKVPAGFQQTGLGTDFLGVEIQNQIPPEKKIAAHEASRKFSALQAVAGFDGDALGAVHHMSRRQDVAVRGNNHPTAEPALRGLRVLADDHLFGIDSSRP